MKQNSKTSHIIHIKNKNDLDNYKKRQQNHIQGTLKITLANITNQHLQIYYHQYRNCTLSQIKQLYSHKQAFQIASTIVKASRKLSFIYGNFILNQNMVFRTIQNMEVFIWINTDLFSNQPKIYLPEKHEGQLLMIKGLINYFKLWLQTDYTNLLQATTLDELQLKILSLKNKNNLGSSSKGQNQIGIQHRKSHGSTKHQFDRYSFRSKNVQKCSPSIKDSQQGKNSKYSNNRIQFKHIFNYNGRKNDGLSSKQSQTDQQKQHDFLLQNKKHQNSLISRTTGTPAAKLFPFKTTSANSNKILELIRNADDNPDQYVRNQIKIDPQKMKQYQNQQKRKKMKQSLNAVGQQLDNLFLSNMEQQEQDLQQIQKMEKQFQQILS